MTYRTAVLAGALSLIAAGCAARPDPNDPGAVLMDADRAFAAATARSGVEGWVSFFAADGTMFLREGAAEGAGEIRRRMAPVFADPENTLSWEPTRATMAASGDLGFTVGRWENRRRTPEGASMVSARGSYVTIWGRQADGAWKVVVDIGNSDATEAPPSSAGADD